MNNNWDLLTKKAEEFNISLNDKQIEQFKKYWKFLDDYNKHTNLVSNSDQQNIIIKHFIDSISIGLLSKELNWNSVQKIIDIGIGGGFPGVPIIIANPQWKLCAIDSVGKKTKFISLLSETIGIMDRIEVITVRAEELAHDKTKREKFDLAVSRAVSQLSTLSEYCLPFVKKNGFFVSYKAKNIDEEIKTSKNAITNMGGILKKSFVYNIPDEKLIERNLILIKKTKPTPQKYPRKVGIPKKLPL